MTDVSITECAFFVPIRRDANLSDGETHDAEIWNWLKSELYDRFGAATEAPGLYEGFYRDPDTGEQVPDSSRRFIVAIDPARFDELRDLLRLACDKFQQKCIYLSISGQVEFVEKQSDDPA